MPANQAQVILLVALIAAAVVGGIFSLLHAFASINLSSDQIISATALNLFSPALIGFILLTSYKGGDIIIKRYTYKIKEVPLLNKIPIIGDIFFENVSIGLYLSIMILIVVYIFLYKTKYGFRLRALWGKPSCCRFIRNQYLSLSLCCRHNLGCISRLENILFTLSNVGTFQSFNATGIWFLGDCGMIFGAWRPLRVLFAATFFWFYVSNLFSIYFNPFFESTKYSKSNI